MSDELNQALAQAVPEGDDVPTLREIVAVAERQVRLEEEIKKQEEELKNTKAELHRVRTQVLPNMIQSAGLSAVPLESGLIIRPEPFYSCTIQKDRAAGALQWLRDNGHGDIIKNQVVLSFGSGRDEEAEKWVERAKKKEVPYDQKESVHPQTLTKFLKTTAEEGGTLPEELFNTFIGTVTKVKTK